MSFSSQEFESYVPVYDTIPEKWEEGRQFLIENNRKLANGINIRTIGWYLDEELLSGNAFIPSALVAPGNNPGLFRQILRKVIVMGALPNTGVLSVPHGIMVDANFTLIQLYGAATDPIGLTSIPLPYVNPTVSDSIALNMDATNINITTHDNESNYTRCNVVVEYIQEL